MMTFSREAENEGSGHLIDKHEGGDMIEDERVIGSGALAWVPKV